MTQLFLNIWFAGGLATLVTVAVDIMLEKNP